jgi:hypothetical protein
MDYSAERHRNYDGNRISSQFMKHGKGRSEVFRQALAEIRPPRFRQALAKVRLPGLQQALAKIRPHWPLWLTLAAQALLTVLLLGKYGPANDEALYIKAGHLEWAHWLHGSPLPDFSSYFSGAPVLWPPVAGLGDSIGGVAGARLISMIFMLGVTVLTYLAALHLGGRQVAAFTAPIMGLTGLASYLGASATFEPMAIFLLALSLFVAVRTTSLRGIAVAGCLLGLSGAVKYAALAWYPFVIAVPALSQWRGLRVALRSSATMAGAALATDGALLIAGGKAYRRAIASTTVARSSHVGGVASPASVLKYSIVLVGGVLVLALLAVVFSAANRMAWPHTSMLAVLTAALLVVPLDQARLGQLYSLDRNTGFGVPFGAIAAGFGLSYGLSWATSRASDRWHYALRAGFVVPVIIIAALGLTHSWQGHLSLSHDRRIAVEIASKYRPGTHVAIVGQGAIEQYYLPGIPPSDWVNILKRRTFTGFLARNQISVIVLIDWQRFRRQDMVTLFEIRKIKGWKLARKYGHGKTAIQVWAFDRQVALNGE